MQLQSQVQTPLQTNPKFKRVPIEVTRVFREIESSVSHLIVNEGGARSSKSYSLCQYFIFKKLMIVPNYNLLVLRKIKHSLKLSTYKTFIDMLKQYGIYDELKHNKSDLIYTFPNGNYVMFSGMDNREKLKSTEWVDVWLEEANEFDKEDLLFVKTRMSKKAEGVENKIYLSYNPEECWIQDLEGKPDTQFIFSCYKDNPTLTQQYIDTLESLKDEDEAYHKIYALGLRAKKGTLIYDKYIMEKTFPDSFADEWYGLDYAFNKPCGLVKLNVPEYNSKHIYLTELIYQTKLTTPEVDALMLEAIPHNHRDYPIYADSEDPRLIKELQDSGWNVIPANKYAGSVREGILFCRKYKYHSLSTNVNLNKERISYKWKTDRVTGKLLDEPVKFRDHLMDGKRYGMFMHKGEAEGNPTSIKEALKNLDEGIDCESAVERDAYLTN